MGRKVIASFESPDGSHGVDIFSREDSSFGFEEFRGETDGAARWRASTRSVSQRRWPIAALDSDDMVESQTLITQPW